MTIPLLLFFLSTPALPCGLEPDGANPSRKRFDDETNKAATREMPCSFSWARLAAERAFFFAYFSLLGLKVHLVWQISIEDEFNLGLLVLKTERRQRMGIGSEPSVFKSQQFMK